MSVPPAIRTRDFEGAPGLERPLNDVLQAFDGRIASLEALARTFLIENVVIRMGAALVAGADPFPIRLGLPQGVTLAGLVVVRIVNQSAAGNAGIPVNGVAVNGWHQEGGYVIVDLISGLGADTTYNLTLGGFRAL